MKLTAIAIYKWESDKQAVQLGLVAELSNFGYFQRGSVKETIAFFTRTIVERTQPGQRQTVKQDDYYCHVHVRDSGIAGIVVSDKEYPVTAAFSVVGKVLDDYLQANGDGWRTLLADNTSANPQLEQALVTYQEPASADKLLKIQRDLDETKIILHQTIDTVLKRGEKLDSLVDKSQDLSMASQMFYKQARKTNACCKMM